MFQKQVLGDIKKLMPILTNGGAFGKLKFESGVHRVQRVPVAEANGIHICSYSSCIARGGGCRS